MKIAHLLAGAALAVSLASAASAADLLVTPDPIYDSALFDLSLIHI